MLWRLLTCTTGTLTILSATPLHALSLSEKNDPSCKIEVALKSNPKNVRTVCQATLLPNSAVAFNPQCLPLRLSRHTQKLQVNCLGGAVVKELDVSNQAAVLKDDKGIFYLPLDMTLEIPLHASVSDFGDSTENCQYQSSTGLKPVSEFRRQDVKDWGAPVMCPKDAEQVIVGIMGATGVLSFENQELMGELKARPNPHELANVCQELGNCLEDLVGMPDDLSDKIAILEHMARRENPELKSSVATVKIEADQLLRTCHQRKISDGLQTPELNQGLWASFQGGFEELYLSAFNDNEDIADTVIGDSADLLSDPAPTRERVLTWLNSPAQKDLSSLDLVKGSAQIVATDVIRSKMSELKLTDPAEQELALAQIMPGFSQCLESAANASTKVKECVAALEDQAPMVIARQILEQQFDKHFRAQFPTDDEAKRVHELTMASYERCLADFYLKSENADQSKEDLARACVYEAMAHAFNIVAQEKVDKHLSELELSPLELRSLRSDIMRTGMNCSFGSTIAKAPNYSQNDRRFLAKIATPEFESAVKGCQNQLTTNASDILIPKILSAHPDIVKSFSDPSERQSFVDRVVSGPYQKCKEWFEQQNIAFEVDVCEGVVRHHAFREVAGRELSKKAQDYGVSDHLKVMLDFKVCTAQIEANLLQLTPDLERETKELACLKTAVADLAALAVPVKIAQEIESQPSLLALKERIMNDEAIGRLPDVMRSCLGEKLAPTQDLESFNTTLAQEIENCTFETTKGAYSEIVPIVLEHELIENIADPARREAFIERFKTATLEPKIAQMQMGDQASEFLATIKKEVMRSFASEELDSLLSEPLQQIRSTETRENIKEDIGELFLKCVDESTDVEACPKQITLAATKMIGSAATAEKIDAYLQGDKARELKERASKQLNECVDRLEDPTEAQAKACVGVTAISLTASIPVGILKEYSGALGSSFRGQKFDQEIEKVRAFYEDGKKVRFNGKDPAITLYASLHTCLILAREEQRKQTLTLESALNHSEKCSSEFETNVVSQMRQKFTAVGKTRAIRTQLSGVFDVLMLFKDAPKATGATGAAVNSELTSLMALLAEMSQDACHYDAATCKARINALKKDMQAFAARTPKPTQDALKERLIKSKFMDLVIEAQVAKSLNGELHKGLATMKDRTGYLDQSITTITSPQILRAIMDSNKGKVLLAEVKAKLMAGDTANLTESPRIRRALSAALISNTKNNSLIDHLFYGIVEPQIIDQKSSFAGVMGRALGIVKGRNFTWREIRNTPEGAQARSLFARFFAGVVEGSVQASDIKGSPRQLKARGLPSEKEITDLLTQGLKRLR